MGEGPTLVGSITANLDLNTKEWDLKVGEVKEKSKELGDLHPEVKVKADVGPALAKLSEVEAAEKRLDVATRQAANSASTAYIANERLAAVMEKRGRTDLQVAAASEAAARADRNAEAAEIRLIAATKALDAAQHSAALKAEEKAAATDAETESTKRATQANHQRVSGLQVLIALAPAILAAGVPIAAGAVGLATSFGVMGLSGVLAFKGIKDAMVVGDGVGQHYATGLGVLKGNLDQLEATSANKMLGGFARAVDDVNASMPFLNRLVGEGASLLGNMGSTALRGVLSGLQQMNPLIQQSGVELGKFVSWLFSFAGTDGFSDFIKYASQNLPAVMHLIENLVTLAGHIMAAYAPLGPVMLAVLNGITDALNALPLPVLVGLVTAATAVAPALRIAGAAMGLFAVESQLAVPVVGILMAALAGIALGVASANAEVTNGTAALTLYTQALKDDNDAIGEHTRAAAAKALADADAFTAASELGISQKTLTDAVLGSTDAINRVNHAVEKNRAFVNDAEQKINDYSTGISVNSAEQNRVAKNIDTVTNQLKGQSDAIAKGKQQNLDFTEATKGAAGALDSQTRAAQEQADQYGVSISTYQSAVAAQDKAKLSTDAQTLAMQLQNNAAGLLKMAWDELNGKTVTAAQAQNAFDSSLANMGDHVSATGKKIHFTTTSIHDMSAASVALRGQLIGQVTNMQKVIEANGGLDESTGKAKKQYTEMRQQIIDNAVAHGVNEDAVIAYVDELFKIPPVKKTKLELDAEAATAKAEYLKWLIDNTNSKTVYLHAETSVGGPDPGQHQVHDGQVGLFADGGQVSYLASGGHPGHPQGTDTVPTWLTPGEIVIKRASVESLGAGNLLHANRTGQWPAQAQPQQNGPVTVNLVLDGQIIDSRIVDVSRLQVQAGISAANQDASRRPSR